MRVATQALQLWIGLALCSFSTALMVRAKLGLAPWDVFHQGVSEHAGISMGTVVIVVGAVLLLSWIPLRQRPGVGTVCNALLIGLMFDVVLPWIPATHRLDARVAMLVTGVLLFGVATGMYVSVGWGPGPRDGLMTGLARRTGLSVRLTRTAIELTVLFSGWLLGGSVGIGTVLFAVAIGPLAQLFLHLFGYETTPKTASTAAGTGAPGAAKASESSAATS